MVEKVIMRALADCGEGNGDDDPEWWRGDAQTILNALAEAGLEIVPKFIPHHQIDFSDETPASGGIPAIQET
jgi:hypothetical protein